MSQAEIEQTIIAMLRDLQAGSGDETYEITSATRPLTELGFFDSLLALETTIALEERLELTSDEDSIFMERKTATPRTIAEIAARMAQVSVAAA